MRLASVMACALAATVACFSAPARGAADEPPVVDVASLLRALVDESRESLVALPVASSAVYSSRDQGSIEPTEPAAWYSESDSGNALRVDRVDGRSEWVLAEVRGAGALTRIVVKSSSVLRDAVLRIRLDGESVPSIEWPLREVARSIVPRLAPYAVWHQAMTAGGAASQGDAEQVSGTIDCVLPIPFERSCVVTLDRRPDLYRIESVSFAEGARVERLTGEWLRATSGSELATLQADARTRLAIGNPAKLSAAALAPGGRLERTVEPRDERGGVIRTLAIQIDPMQAGAAVRDLWVECDFDGTGAVRMPLGHFIGLGEHTGPTADAFRRVGPNGAMEFRLPMPFARSARIALVNRGRSSLDCALEVTRVEPRTSAEQPQLLHGAWRLHPRLVVDAPVEVELARIDGAGVLVGECVTQHAALFNWWPSGDERIKIDGRDELAGPSYDLSFGSAPGLPRLARGLLVSIPIRDQGQGARRWSASRLRALDSVRFSQSLVQTLEVQPAAFPGWEITLSHSVLWYARAGESRGVGFDDPSPMPAVATPRNYARLAEIFPAGPGEEWFEVESLSISGWTRGSNWGPTNQSAIRPGAAWGGGETMGLLSFSVGEAIEFAVPARDEAPRRLTGRFVRSPDAARVLVSVNGVRVPGEVVLASPTTEPSDLIDLGVHAPKGGRFLVRVEVAGQRDSQPQRRHIQVDGFRTSPP